MTASTNNTNTRALPNRIYLVGMPASGKSRLGRATAPLIGYSFIDLDDVIEDIEKASINQIFAEQGEEYFRKVEQKALHQTLPNKTIIACGGGTPCFFDNMNFIKTHGFSVYLNETLDNLLAHLKEQQGTRPLLNSLTEGELRHNLEQKLLQRIPYYQQADISLSSEEIEPEMLVAILQKKFIHHAN